MREPPEGEDHRALQGIVELLNRHVQCAFLMRDGKFAWVEFYDAGTREWYRIVIEKKVERSEPE